jgi:hypothetical protein
MTCLLFPVAISYVSNSYLSRISGGKCVDWRGGDLEGSDVVGELGVVEMLEMLET